jgi:hypothetical protein
VLSLSNGEIRVDSGGVVMRRVVTTRSYAVVDEDGDLLGKGPAYDAVERYGDSGWTCGDFARFSRRSRSVGVVDASVVAAARPTAAGRSLLVVAISQQHHTAGHNVEVRAGEIDRAVSRVCVARMGRLENAQIIVLDASGRARWVSVAEIPVVSSIATGSAQ